jgi:hypothetical protein
MPFDRNGCLRPEPVLVEPLQQYLPSFAQVRALQHGSHTGNRHRHPHTAADKRHLSKSETAVGVARQLRAHHPSSSPSSW